MKKSPLNAKVLLLASVIVHLSLKACVCVCVLIHIVYKLFDQWIPLETPVCINQDTILSCVNDKWAFFVCLSMYPHVCWEMCV